jgi:DNA-binding Lrp family transcriptional regulator
MRLKQLSDYIGKGKTTIHHHVRKFEEEGILTWVESKEDKKKLKTRHYSISEVLGEDWEDKNSLIGMMKIESLINSYLTNLMIKYLEEHSQIDESLIGQFGEPFIIKIPLTKDIRSIYKDFITKLSKIYKIKKIDEFLNRELTPIDHFGTQYYSFWIPIKEVLEWKQKLKESK